MLTFLLLHNVLQTLDQELHNQISMDMKKATNRHSQVEHLVNKAALGCVEVRVINHYSSSRIMPPSDSNVIHTTATESRTRE